MKLTYWYAQCINDSDVYSVREKTRKAAKAKLEQYDASDKDGWKGNFHPPVKVEIEYADAFELMAECSHEGHHWWEAQAVNALDLNK